MDYYLMLEGNVYGPYTLPQMKSLQLFADTPIHLSVWPTDKWVYASDLPELRECISNMQTSVAAPGSTSRVTNVIQVVQPPQSQHNNNSYSDSGTVPPNAQNYPPSNPEVVDNGGFGWGLLGCCIPIAGLILYFVWKDTKPKTAHALCIGTIIGAVLTVLDYIVLIALGVLEGIMGAM